WRPEDLGIERNKSGPYGIASTRDLGGARIIDCPGDAIGLSWIAGIIVAVDGAANALAQFPRELGSDCCSKKKPELKIAGRGFHRHARTDCRWRCPSHVLVGIAIAAQSKHRNGIEKLAALTAAYICRYRAAFARDVVAGLGVADRSVDHAFDVVELEAAWH